MMHKRVSVTSTQTVQKKNQTQDTWLQVRYSCASFVLSDLSYWITAFQQEINLMGLYVDQVMLSRPQIDIYFLYV